MWLNRLSLQSTGSVNTFTCTEDIFVGNLHNFLGNPAGPQDVTFIVDGCDVGLFRITADWDGGSTFVIQCINGGRVLGLSGTGGVGGNDFEATGTAGQPGGQGQPALQSDGFTVDIDIDDGFLLGGGGGGGGGGWQRTAGFPILLGNPGSGGGGGQGFLSVPGALPGTFNFLPAGNPGGGGGLNGPGAGGAGAGANQFPAGGAGGGWGSGGRTGHSQDPLNFNGGLSFNGGVGGRGGQAFRQINGATLNLIGAKSEATLRTEGRIRGETAFKQVALNATSLQVFDNSLGTVIVGWLWDNNGNLTKVKFPGTGGPVAGFWSDAPLQVGFGDDYEVRISSRPGLSTDREGTITTFPASDGTWVDLVNGKQWSAVSGGAGINAWGALFEVRRKDFFNPDDIIDSIWLTAEADHT